VTVVIVVAMVFSALVVTMMTWTTILIQGKEKEELTLFEWMIVIL
jgi:hypothetical protein